MSGKRNVEAHRAERLERRDNSVYLIYRDAFTDGNGYPVSIPDLHPLRRKEALAAARKQVEITLAAIRRQAQAEGKDPEVAAHESGLSPDVLRAEMPVIEGATYSQMVAFLVNTVNDSSIRQKDDPAPTMSETLSALHILEAFRAPHNGYVQLAKEDLDWLQSYCTLYGHRVFPNGACGAVLRTRLDEVYKGIPPEYK